MGRVRKYKKVKSVDPFSNAKRSVADTKYDQPPSIWEGESRKAAKRANYAFDNEKAFERMLQHAAKRQLKIEEDNGRQATGKDGAKKIKAVEAKRDDEPFPLDPQDTARLRVALRDARTERVGDERVYAV